MTAWQQPPASRVCDSGSLYLPIYFVEDRRVEIRGRRALSLALPKKEKNK